MRTIVITGATSGIGFAATRDLTHRGYLVIGIGHSEGNCILAEERIMSENPEGRAVFFAADLMQQREVLRIADVLAEYLNGDCGGELHAFISNAGCVRSWYTTTEEGYEQQFALNYLAGFLLSYRLLPFLRKGKGRVILTGSESHKGTNVHWDDVMLQNGYNPLKAYKQSKLCNILFAKGFNDRCADQGVRAYVVDPGLVKTEIGCKQTGSLVHFIWTLRKKHGVSPEIPAQTYAFLCEQEPRPNGLYYRLSSENRYSKRVTEENAARLFALSEKLCGIHYDGMEAAV